jgi:hypothetical protein
MAEPAEFATDLKDVYPNKEVTLLHSRMRFMPHYPVAMHTASEHPTLASQSHAHSCQSSKASTASASTSCWASES